MLRLVAAGGEHLDGVGARPGGGSTCRPCARAAVERRVGAGALDRLGEQLCRR